LLSMIPNEMLSCLLYLDFIFFNLVSLSGYFKSIDGF